MYLISRFFFITAQTKEFPTILVMMSMNVTAVMATLADSGMAEDEKKCRYIDDITRRRGD